MISLNFIKMGMQDKINELFRAIDSMDADRFITFLTEDAQFKFGNNPKVIGKDAVKEAVKEFFSSIKGLSHEVINTWSHPDTIICQGEVTYTRKNDSKVTIPFVNIFGIKENLVKDYLIYIDIAPLFANLGKN